MSPLPALLDHNGLMRQLQLRSRLDAQALLEEPAEPAPAIGGMLRSAGAGHHDLVAAEAAPAGEEPLESLLRRRASVRSYAPRPVDVGEISAVVDRAAAFDQASWPDHDAGAELEFLVAARDVTGLRAGMYLYSAASRAFVRLADLPAGAAAEDLVLQLEFAHAPAIVIVCGPLAASLDRHGEHGHRLLLTRAGAAAHTAWLTALDRGLAGSIFAGFLSSALKPLVQVDGYRSAQLIAFACGHPAGE
ncbi:nitroreductase family protein [Streptomyces sp. NPDC006172]|uniref:nitroreductase family protein n=1 Tax=Streptomyces sp. NPDC006172 TaxID=3154470 RepID=UPI0033C0C251